MAKPKKPESKTGGTPAWEPTEDELAKLRKLSYDGWTKEAAARAVGKSRFALHRNAKADEVFQEGRDLLVSRVAMKFVDAALAGNVTAMIFFLKAQGGWREPEALDRRDAKQAARAAGEPIKVDMTVALQGKSEQDLKSIEDAIQLLIAAGIAIAPDSASGSASPNATGKTRH